MNPDQLKEQAAWWHSLPSYDKLTFEESVALTEMIDNLFEALRSAPPLRTYEQGAEVCGLCESHNIAWCREVNGYMHREAKPCGKFKPRRALPTQPEGERE